LNAIILAAGKGERLLPLTNNIPKCMIKLGEKSLLERVIEVLRNCNINNISVVTGYCSETINFPNVTYFKNEEYDSTNMTESLFCARPKLNDSVILSYTDIVYEKKIVQQMLNFKGDFGIAVDSKWKEAYVGRTDHPFSEAVNVAVKNDKVVEIRKNMSESSPEQIAGEFIGLSIFSKQGVKILVEKYDALSKTHKGKFHFAPSLKKACFSDMLQELIDSGNKIEPIFIEGKWCEIDTKQDIQRAKTLFD